MKVLVVDDDRNTVEVIIKSVHWNRLGIESPRYAYDVNGAKGILNEEDIAIVICDIEMPMGSGIDLIIWARENQKKAEFLFLTCHESFEFASYAIQYQAAAYLIKPFEPEKMEVELHKLMGKLHREQDLLEAEKYKSMWMGSKEYLESGFWEELLFGHIQPEESAIGQEIAKRKLSVPIGGRWVLLCAIARKYDSAWEEWEEDVLEYSLAKLGCEILKGEEEKQNMLYRSDETAFYMIQIMPEEQAEELRKKGKELLRLCEAYLNCSLTCYLSAPYSLMQLAGVKNRILKCDADNLLNRERLLEEGEWEESGKLERPALDLQEIEEELSAGNQIKILNRLKSMLEKMVEDKAINTAALRTIQLNLTQVVYVYLYRNGIEADELFAEDAAVKLKEKALYSVVDMMKWQNYLIHQALTYTKEVQEAGGMVRKIKDYIREHYREDIGRREVAAAVYLTPEYMAKLFKKDMGISLKDYIHQLRIGEAKRLLAGGTKVSEVAQEVGFDNFSYFSTVFKRQTGVSPNEYKKQYQKEKA